MAMLALGLLIFLGVHSIGIVSPVPRTTFVARFGESAWMALYSVVSLAGFALVIVGYGEARQQPVRLYMPPVELRHAAVAIMLPVFPLLFAAYLPGRIKSAVKHPMLIGTCLWGAAHLLVTGTLHAVLLFGGFLAWAVLDLVSLAGRPGKQIRTAPAGRLNDILAVGAGLLVYAAMVSGLHLWMTGASPF